MALLCQLMTSPIEACSPSSTWRPLTLERRLSDADLAVYAMTVSILNDTMANETHSIGFILLHIEVLVSLNPCIYTKGIIGGVAGVFWYRKPKCCCRATRTSRSFVELGNTYSLQFMVSAIVRMVLA